MSSPENTDPSRTTIKIAAKSASKRPPGADPGPGDPAAAPSVAPELVEIPKPPTASELVVKSNTQSRKIATINEPKTISLTNAPKSTMGNSASKQGSAAGSAAQLSINDPATVASEGGAIVAPSQQATKTSSHRSGSHHSSTGHHKSASPSSRHSEGAAGSHKSTSGAHEGAAGSHKSTSGAHEGAIGSTKHLSGSANKPSSSTGAGGGSFKEHHSKSSPVTEPMGGSKDGSSQKAHESSGAPDASGGPSGPSASVAMQADSQAGQGLDREEGLDTEPEKSASPKSAGLETGPSSAGGKSKMGPKTSSMKHQAAKSSLSSGGPVHEDDTAKATASPSDSGQPGKKKKVTKFRYHKRITVRTHGKTSPSQIMDKVNKKDKLTPSAIEEMDPQEIIRRAGIKGSKNTHWRVRLRQTKRLIKNGKTVTETKVAYRDSDGNKRIRTSSDPNCKKCGKKLEECKCDQSSKS